MNTRPEPKETPEMNTPATDPPQPPNEQHPAELDEFDEFDEFDCPDDASEINELRAQLAEAEKKILMGQADMENFQRRLRRDTQDQIRYASTPLITELLESIDNLQRAVDSYEQAPNAEGLAEGVKMVLQQLNTTIENHGCKKIDAVGHPFDPTCHQAVQMQPSDQYDPNTVMAELRPGFKHHDRVIRPTQVIVSTGPPTDS